MTTIYLAHTVPVNPPGATPVLSEAQVFAGFQRKIRQPGEFVPAIAASEVLSDADGVVKRKVTFKAAPNADHPTQVVEVCTEHAPHRVDYALDNGSTVLNLISTGSSGNADDLYVTYAFAWKHPESLAVGSAEYSETEARHKAVAKLAVESSIATTRRLVSEGAI
ncbi:hypothetical protein SPBR_01081 [Sporothrix brasiliensis 5110]|uniref:DUF1857 domain containing protein n=1 Tax=Sporothrix brasiliensis 5110 TaxID=1398154 RepID=A0A0C2IXQ3_9PEZI|nr:uncharacterized protein SPBR_01081 [Sporothrix brasiliensis 5110]KIH89817.1 hypothetical protein SPBR_01081 [Sporothrix brasiliensis 5110]